jgi:CHAD domain-containing protein
MRRHPLDPPQPGSSATVHQRWVPWSGTVTASPCSDDGSVLAASGLAVEGVVTGEPIGMASELIEREIKYDVPADFLLPDMQDLLPEGGRIERLTIGLESLYFDTDEHDLLAHGITLRRRTGPIDAGWQLKVPSDDSRTEIRVDPTGNQTTVPKELAALTAGVRRGKALRSNVNVTTDRTTIRLLDAADEMLAEVGDDRVHAVRTGQRIATLNDWREVEAEVGLAGDEDFLTRINERLTRSGAQPSNSPNKVSRALGVTGVDSDTGKPRAVGDVIHGYLAAQERALISGDLNLRRGLGGIHPTRVATRRLRSTLRVFAAYFDRALAESYDAELSWYAKLLGQVRDREVQRARFAAAIAELPDEQVLGPVAGRIEQHLLTEQLQHQRTLLKAMNSKRYFALLEHTRRWVTDPPFTPEAKKKPAKLRAQVRAAAKKVDKHLAAALEQGDDEELHKTRKAGKRARYAAELARPVLGKKVRHAVHRYEDLQDILGEHQDCVVAADLLRRLAAGTPDVPNENGFTYGLLYARELDHAEKSRHRARSWQ